MGARLATLESDEGFCWLGFYNDVAPTALEAVRRLWDNRRDRLDGDSFVPVGL